MTALAQEIARVYGTPSVVIDLDRVERNIAKLQAACDAAGIANRPHIKTHKSPILAKMQRDAGAKGITCQKLGEAEVMADAGFDDILISYNILGEEKLGRLAALMGRANMAVAADNPVTVAGLPKAAAAAGRDSRRHRRMRHGLQAGRASRLPARRSRSPRTSRAAPACSSRAS